MPTFRPKPQARARRHVINVELSEEEYAGTKADAAKSGVSMKEFAYQGLMFARAHMDKDTGT